MLTALMQLAVITKFSGCSLHPKCKARRDTASFKAGVPDESV
jgi:hypothetical protein